MRIRELAIGAVLTALLAGGVALTVPSPTPLATVPAAVVLSAPPNESVPGGVIAPPLATAQAPVSWREMHARYAGARSLRAFFYEVLRKPDHGAFLYAFGVLDTCKRAMSKPALDLGGVRGEAAQALRQRCDFTPDGLEDAERELHAVRGLDLRDDPLLDSMVSYLSVDGPEGKAKMLLAAFEQGDARVIASLLTPAIEADAGLALDGNANALSLPVGAALLACRLGADCGPDSLRTLELCMTKGWCAGSVPAALQQGLGKQFAAFDRIAAGRRN